MFYYVRVRGVWDSSPSIYLGPFDDYESALDAVIRAGVRLDTPPADPKRDVAISILSDEEARLAGRNERHTLPPAREGDDGEGFEVPADWAEFTKIFYRRFGRH